MEETAPPKVVPVSCPKQGKKTSLIEAEFAHTQKRLAREKIAPLIQFIVFAYNCDDPGHGADAGAAFHIDCASIGSNMPLPGGLESSIQAVEHLLRALKAKLQ